MLAMLERGATGHSDPRLFGWQAASSPSSGTAYWAPDITQTLIAPVHMQNYGGDLEEALGFLKMTALTATPAQLAQLGLTRRKESAKGRKDALAAWRREAANKGSGSASNSARSTLGSGSGDEGLMAVAREARSRFAGGSAPGQPSVEQFWVIPDGHLHFSSCLRNCADVQCLLQYHCPLQFLFRRAV